MRERFAVLGRRLAEQGRDALTLLRGVRPARGIWVLVGVACTASAILVAAIVPLLVQRVIAADDLATANSFTALALAMLAQSGLIYIGATLLAYITAELFAPRRGLHLRGPRQRIWRSLHRLGNATSITLVIGVTGTAIGIALLGEELQDAGTAGSPGELGAIQLGVLLFVLLVALAYEAVRVVVDLLDGLPALWRWLSALVYPWIAAVVSLGLLPVDVVARAILRQWGTGVSANVSIEADGVVGTAFVTVAVLWVTHFVASGQLRRFRSSLRPPR